MVRPHPGQIRAAALMRALLEDSEIRESHRENDPRGRTIQPRCAPQVLGARGRRDPLCPGHGTVVELNASTDNPLVFENGE